MRIREPETLQPLDERRVELRRLVVVLLDATAERDRIDRTIADPVRSRDTLDEAIQVAEGT
ncbi:hypothetical protein [Streptomyces coriariae]|uniref:hypothetical protein n=1 Tax=Streptomyces coriariae TaxID=2864460 RepID=UPI001E3D9B00|nr:hypothetical protein [Streptomyces coriariae]